MLSKICVLILAVVIFTILFLNAEQTYACMPRLEPHLIILCKDNVCTKGFRIDDSSCFANAMKITDLPGAGIHNILAQYSTSSTTLNGVYEFDGRLEKLSESSTPQEFLKYKIQWQIIVLVDAFRTNFSKLYLPIFILLTILSILWHWFLMKYKKINKIGLLFFVAILIKLSFPFVINILFLIFGKLNYYGQISNNFFLESILINLCLLAVGCTLLIDIFYLLYRFLRKNKVKSA